MKTIKRLLSAFFVMLLLSGFASWDKSDPIDPEVKPFSNGGNDRNMIVIISDLHLGADLNYAECKNNQLPLPEGSGQAVCNEGVTVNRF